MVRLEEQSHITEAGDGLDFNSKMVRLEVATSLLLTFIPTHFNSKMVRLEANFGTGGYVINIQFQFQNGTIRRKYFMIIEAN